MAIVQKLIQAKSEVISKLKITQVGWIHKGRVMPKVNQWYDSIMRPITSHYNIKFLTALNVRSRLDSPTRWYSMQYHDISCENFISFVSSILVKDILTLSRTVIHNPNTCKSSAKLLPQIFPEHSTKVFPNVNCEWYCYPFSRSPPVVYCFVHHSRPMPSTFMTHATV